MFLVPLEILYFILNKKLNAADAPYLVFVLTLLNCTLRVVYGLSGDEKLLYCFYGNVAGIPLAYCFFLIFLYLRTESLKSVLLWASFILVVFIGILVLFLVWLNDISQHFAGYTGMVVNIMMYGAPISAIVTI